MLEERRVDFFYTCPTVGSKQIIFDIIINVLIVKVTMTILWYITSRAMLYI